MKIKRVEVEFVLGTDLKDAVWHAYMKVIETKAMVVFRFNGLTITIEPDNATRE